MNQGGNATMRVFCCIGISPGGQQTTSEEMPMIQQGLGSSNVFPQTLGKTGQDRPIDTAQAWKDTTEGILASPDEQFQASRQTAQ